MKQVKLGDVPYNGLFRFINDPEARDFRVISERKDNVVFYVTVSRPEDDFDLTLANSHPDWLTSDVDVFVED